MMASSAAAAAAEPKEKKKSKQRSEEVGSASAVKKMILRRPKDEERLQNIRIQENPTSVTPPEDRSLYTPLEDATAAGLATPRRCSEAMAHHISEAMAMKYRPSPLCCDPRAKDPSQNYDTHSFYCICHECQARYLTTTKSNDESQQSTEGNKSSDSFGDAVIPFEMMDGTFGMAACALM